MRDYHIRLALLDSRLNELYQFQVRHSVHFDVRKNSLPDLLLPDNDLNGMLIHLQWIGMEYAAIRYSIFLSWLLSGEHTLTYNDIRDAIVILTRMTGYDDDIYEYLENSFESLYWEWGYFAMILADV